MVIVSSVIAICVFIALISGYLRFSVSTWIDRIYSLLFLLIFIFSSYGVIKSYVINSSKSVVSIDTLSLSWVFYVFMRMFRNIYVLPRTGELQLQTYDSINFVILFSCIIPLILNVKFISINKILLILSVLLILLCFSLILFKFFEFDVSYLFVANIILNYFYSKFLSISIILSLFSIILKFSRFITEHLKILYNRKFK